MDCLSNFPRDKVLRRVRSSLLRQRSYFHRSDPSDVCPGIGILTHLREDKGCDEFNQFDLFAEIQI